MRHLEDCGRYARWNNTYITLLFSLSFLFSLWLTTVVPSILTDKDESDKEYKVAENVSHKGEFLLNPGTKLSAKISSGLMLSGYLAEINSASGSTHINSDGLSPIAERKDLSHSS